MLHGRAKYCYGESNGMVVGILGSGRMSPGLSSMKLKKGKKEQGIAGDIKQVQGEPEGGKRSGSDELSMVRPQVVEKKGVDSGSKQQRMLARRLEDWGRANRLQGNARWDGVV